MMPRIFWITLFLSVASIARGQYADVTSPYIKEVLDETVELMNVSKYDSAHQVITGAFVQTEVPISTSELYIMRCLEAEILYYNALFEQGLNTSLWSLEVAEEIGSDRFKGNSHNLIGLFLMNLNRYQEAVSHFKIASSLISSEEKSDFLSQKYHALGNLGECYLKLNKPDSTIFYSLISLDEAQKRDKVRGVGFAKFNMAEAYILKSDFEHAKQMALEGYMLVKDTPHRDVIQYLCSSFMEVYSQTENDDSLNYWMQIGLAENENPLNTDLSRMMFLQESFDVSVKRKDIAYAQDLLAKLNALQVQLNEKQQSQRITILKDYYEKNNQLALAEQQAKAQRDVLQLRTGVLIALSAVALLLIVLFFIFRKNSVQKQRIAALEQKETLFRERNRIASDLHDDIGAALSSIRIYSGAAQKQLASNPDESTRLINRINETSSGLMEQMSDIVWSINPRDDSGQSVALRMKSFASEVLGSLDVQVNYRIDEQFERIRPTSLAKRNLYLIFKEAINNIGKYSNASQVHVELEVKHHEVIMRISDNGAGFDLDQARKGNGLHNMKLRAAALRGILDLTSAPGVGTTIVLHVPLANISDSQ
jgi:two-component system sensor histidine kinase UhpB